MSITLATDLDVFAAERSKVQADREEALYRSALHALRRFGTEGWYDALVERATRVMREQYHADTGRWTSARLRKEQDQFRKAARKTLSRTKKPTPDTIESTARSIAASLSTGAVNAALEAAGADDDRTNLGKTWVSREDESVRPTHKAAHGQTVAVGEKFDVGGSKMDRPGDLSAPIGEWANCRCLLAVVEMSLAADGRNTRVTAAAETDHEAERSIGIFALPREGDPVNAASSEDVAHMTVIWLGTDAQRADAGVDLPLDDIKADVKAAAASLQVIDAPITERGVLGDDEADVVFIEADSVRSIREALLEHETILDAMKAVEQYPEWTPHVTLGYPERPGVVQYDAESVVFDRLALWVGDSHYEYPLGGDMAEDQTTAEEPQAPAPEDRLDYVDEAIPFWGVLAPEAVESGDGRMFGLGSLRSRPLPLPLAYQKVNEPGHDGSFRVANIERTWRRDGKTYGMGHFLTSIPEIDEVIGVMAESGGRMGVSVDADDGSMEMFLRSSGQSLSDALDEMEEDGDGIDLDDIITVFTSARICGATLCNIPAFHEAFIALGEVPEEFAPVDGEDLAVESRAAATESLAAAGPVKTEDGPGWLTHPVDTDRLRDYWTHGKGAAKIGWGAPGDFNRCRTNLAKYVKPQYLSGYCANRHYDALGYWPGQHHALEALAAAAEAARAVGKEFDDSATVGPGISLVASADLQRPPAEWFADPGLVEPSTIVVTEEGRVFGHLAAWGTCHIGIAGQCVTPPESPSNYAYFRTGSIILSDGQQCSVGQITMDTGHAEIAAKAKAAVAHYDNTGTVVCDVTVGEDAHGIWVAGAVRPETLPEKIEALRRGGALSGDWRTIGGHLELVAALAVNVPGFPIPRVALAASGVEQQSLVAAGVVVSTSEESMKNLTVDEIAAAVFARMSQHLAAKERMDSLRASVQQARSEDAAERMRRIAASRS